jgi:hypothetical protein
MVHAPVTMPNGLLGRSVPVPMPGNPFAYDADAQAYIANVEAADGMPLERAVCVAIHDFVTGCKADANWASLRAAVILAGARSLRGALVPLVGPSPVNNNFVTGDYSRRTGLLGGSSKFLNTRLSASSIPQNNFHYSVFVSTAAISSPTVYFGNGPSSTETGATNFGQETSTGVFTRNQSGTAFSHLNTGTGLRFFATSRQSPANYLTRVNGVTRVSATASQVPYNDNLYVYASGNSAQNASNPRLAFYSAGLAVDLIKFEARVNALAATIAQTAVAR